MAGRWRSSPSRRKGQAAKASSIPISRSPRTRGCRSTALCCSAPATATTCATGPQSPGAALGDSPYIRRLGFERMPGGNKYQIYVHDADAFHTLFELNTADCAAKNVDQGKCDEIARWLRSTALAFLRRPAATEPAGAPVAPEQQHRDGERRCRRVAGQVVTLRITEVQWRAHERSVPGVALLEARALIHDQKERRRGARPRYARIVDKGQERFLAWIRKGQSLTR